MISLQVRQQARGKTQLEWSGPAHTNGQPPKDSRGTNDVGNTEYLSPLRGCEPLGHNFDAALWMTMTGLQGIVLNCLVTMAAR